MKILGDYHMHTKYSDGKDAVSDMVRRAKERGLTEIAITDHGFGKIFKGLKMRQFEKLRGDIQSARGEMPVLFGVESNMVSTRGHIDIPEKWLEKFDIMLFGVHLNVAYSFRAMVGFVFPNLFFKFILNHTPKFMVRRNTKIVKRVIEKNKIDIWTHPSKYFRVDVVEIAKTCAERGTLIELNSKRISFRPIDFERMAATGASFIINSDAHCTRRVGDITKAEEFLKNCDYDPTKIINLNTIFTEWKKNGKLFERNQDGSGAITQEPINKPVTKRHGFFRSRVSS
jgi:putative hydrolase